LCLVAVVGQLSENGMRCSLVQYRVVLLPCSGLRSLNYELMEVENSKDMNDILLDMRL